jgi:class 3 adenylate cyclase
MSTNRSGSVVNRLIKNMSALTLRKKYSLAFTAIFFSILVYIIQSLYNSEQEELIRLSNQQFESLHRVVSGMGTEAMSVGDADKLALGATVQEILLEGNEGLERVFFVSRDNRYYAYADKSSKIKRDTPIGDSLRQWLEGHADKRVVEGNEVYLTKKLMYATSSKNIFLGYSQLVYSLDHIDALIAEKRRKTLLIGLIAFGVSLAFIILITSILVERIKRLNKAIAEMAQGKYPSLLVKGTDELSLLTGSYNDMIVAVKERLIMSRYMSSSTVNMIRKNSHASDAEVGDRDELCIFFSDVRGFTSFSEQNSPDVVVKHLNQLLDVQVGIIQRHHGDIDKFIGDAVMATFRGSIKEDNAMRASIEIQQAMQILVSESETYECLRIGIGIHTGEAVTGNIGSANRMDFTAIGDAVNTASRLCSAALSDEIIISESVKLKLTANFELSEPFTMSLKGKIHAIQLYKTLYSKIESILLK